MKSTSLEIAWSEVAQAADHPIPCLARGHGDGMGRGRVDTLAAAGLTAYANDIERTGDKVRLLALALIYRDSCRRGRDETYDQSALLGEEGAELNFSNVRLGQLVGPTHDAHQIDAEDSELVESARVVGWITNGRPR